MAKRIYKTKISPGHTKIKRFDQKSNNDEDSTARNNWNAEVKENQQLDSGGPDQIQSIKHQPTYFKSLGRSHHRVWGSPPFWGGGPGVGLALCCFVVYSTRRFVVCLSVCHFVLVFFSPFSIAITSLGEERANLSAFRTFVRFVLV